MNGITILLWMTIAILGIIAIIIVKLHYRGDELEKEEGFTFPKTENLNRKLSNGSKITSKSLNRNSSTQQNTYTRLEKENSTYSPSNEAYIVPKVANNNETYELESENQVLINYGNTYEKFQEPIKESQMVIMNQNNDTKNEKHELKDLFTIDELIKESKRKDSEREKESQKIKREDDEDLIELKESIKRRKEHPELDDELLEKVGEDDTIEEETPEIKEETISDLIGETSSEEEKETAEETVEESSSITPKEIEEVINTASEENKKEEVESISESKNITDVLLDNPDGDDEKKDGEDELKAPKKIDEERKDYKFGADLNESNVFGSDDNDLDYRKDLAKITNTIKGSKIFQDVKEKITPERVEVIDDESYIRNVNEYEDDYKPIINARHIDSDATYEDYHNMDNDRLLRDENTRKVFKQKAKTQQRKQTKSKIGTIKSKPSRDNIKIQIGNGDFVLKTGDEIIFNHMGETYSSQVYAINGDDISVRYRRKDITIKPSDVKKIY